MTAPRRLHRLIGGLALTLMVSACVGLPTDGPVQAGRPIEAAAGNPIRIEPPGPELGDDPEAIVTGFIRAGAGSSVTSNGPDVARDFLTPEAARDWQPTSRIVVLEDEVAVSRSGDALTVTSTASGEIDGTGRYQDLAPGTKVRLTFGVRRVDGEWRLSLPEEVFGLWLPRADVIRLFVPSPVYYSSAADRILVPDVRWFANGAGLATTLARALAGPVPAYLDGAVRTGFPGGTSLAVDAVPVIDGVAEVTLTDAAGQADPQGRELMYAQAVATLSGVPAVSRVTLAVGGATLELPGLGESVGSLADLDYTIAGAVPAPRGLLRVGSDLVATDLSNLAAEGTDPQDAPGRGELDGPAFPKVAAGWTSLALALDGQEVAGVGGDLREIRRWRDAQSLRTRVPAGELTRPSYDRYGWMWTVGRSSGSTRVLVLPPDASDNAELAPLDASWLRPRRVVALRVSPDGTRVIVVSRGERGEPERVDIAGVVRSESGVPSMVVQPQQEAHSLTLVRDACWLDPRTVAVLGRVAPTDPIRPYVVRLGEGIGPTPSAGSPEPVANGVAITTTGGPRGIVIRTDEGRAQVRSGSGWTVLPTAAEVLVPGM